MAAVVTFRVTFAIFNAIIKKMHFIALTTLSYRANLAETLTIC